MRTAELQSLAYHLRKLLQIDLPASVRVVLREREREKGGEWSEWRQRQTDRECVRVLAMYMLAA